MKSFKTTESSKPSQVCTSSKYLWIIYLGTKSSETIVNIYSETDPTKSESGKITNVEKNDPNVDANKFEEVYNSTKDSENNLPANYSKDETNNNDENNVEKKELSLLKIIIIISVIGGVLIVLAMTIAILWCCCRRCNKVTIAVPAIDTRKDSCYVNEFQDEDDLKDIEVKVEDPNCQIREGFLTTDAQRDTCNSIDFWTDDEDYEPDNDRHSKLKPFVYAMGHCIYERKSSNNEIYMNSVIPPPPQFEKDKNEYVNMNANPNKHFNIFL